jgi:archaellum component FlaC
MDSLVEYVAIYANILVRSKELDELRERLGELRECVEKAKKLYTAMPAPLRQKPASFH